MNDYLAFIEEVLKEASEIALQYFGNVTSTTKPDDNNQVLTEADIEIGKHLVARTQEVFPEHNVIDEEAGVVDKKSRYTWVIDPIEATSNFASKNPAYAIMIGLLDGDIPVAGGVVLPSMDSMYLAARGHGATHNGEVITVTTEENPLRVLVSYGIDSQRKEPENTINECRVLADVVLNVRNMRNSGCEGLDPMYVAEGKFGGRINCTSKIWDNVAPQIIVEEAGGLWTDTNGDPIDYMDPLTKIDKNYSFCTAAPAIHKKLIEVVDGRLEK